MAVRPSSFPFGGEPDRQSSIVAQLGGGSSGGSLTLTLWEAESKPQAGHAADKFLFLCFPDQLLVMFESVPLCIYITSVFTALCLTICSFSSLPPSPAFPQVGLSLPSPVFLPSLCLCLSPCFPLPVIGLSPLRPSWTSCTRQGSCTLCPPGWSCTQRSALMSALPTCWASRVRLPGSPFSGLASCPASLSAPPLPVLDPSPRPWEAAARQAPPPSLPRRLHPSGLVQVLCGGVEGTIP